MAHITGTNSLCCKPLRQNPELFAAVSILVILAVAGAILCTTSPEFMKFAATKAGKWTIGGVVGGCGTISIALFIIHCRKTTTSQAIQKNTPKSTVEPPQPFTSAPAAPTITIAEPQPPPNIAISPSPPRPPKNEYADVMRRLKPKKLEEIEMAMASIENLDAGVQRLLAAKPDDLEIFKDPNLPHFATEALRQGLISAEEYGSFLYFWNGFQAPYQEQRFHDLKVLPKIELKTGAFLTPDQTKRFHEELDKLPERERRYLTIAREKNHPYGIRTLLEQAQHFKVFYAPDCIVLPSIGMMQALVKAINPGINANIVLGTASLDALRTNCKTYTSDIQISHPLAKTPDFADGFIASGGIDYTFHDCYHFIVRAFIPRKINDLNVEFADALENLQKGNKEMQQRKAVGKVRFAFLDMDEIHLCPDSAILHYSEEEMLWVRIISHIRFILEIDHRNGKYITEQHISKAGEILESLEKEKSISQTEKDKTLAFIRTINIFHVILKKELTYLPSRFEDAICLAIADQQDLSKRQLIIDSLRRGFKDLKIDGEAFQKRTSELQTCLANDLQMAIDAIMPLILKNYDKQPLLTAIMSPRIVSISTARKETYMATYTTLFNTLMRHSLTN